MAWPRLKPANQQDQLKAVLGNTQLQEFARHLGLPVDETLKNLSQYLPDIVDKASPNGTLKRPSVGGRKFIPVFI